MILQPCKLEPKLVELTKIHYYDSSKKAQNLASPSISREIRDNDYNKNVIIKKNIFGQKWVLQINESVCEEKKKTKLRVVIYVLVFCSIIVAVGFGFFFTAEKYFSKFSSEDKADIPDILRNFTSTHQNHMSDIEPNQTITIINGTHLTETRNDSYIKYPYCSECTPLEVCMKLHVTDMPKCLPAVNINDPTGCGGFCKINIQYCEQLDKDIKVYQCSQLENKLRCTDHSFNCGNMCIADKKRCDGSIDCSNNSDEENCDCNLETHFQCGNFTSCLEKSKKCDRKIDCWDKSDEEDCRPATSCINDELPCNDGQCISSQIFCDGFFDCKDQSDEPEGCRRF